MLCAVSAPFASITKSKRNPGGLHQTAPVEPESVSTKGARHSSSHPPGELSMAGSVEEIGLSLVILSLVFACSALIRRWSRPLRKLFMPTAVIGGFLVLGLGPEGMGRLLGGSGIFPNDVFAVWKQLPGVLITAMSASLLLGERLPRLRTVWNISGS